MVNGQNNEEVYEFDFSGIEELKGAVGAGPVRIPPAVYRMKLSSFTRGLNKSMNDMVTVEMAVDGGPEDGTIITDYFTLEGGRPDKRGPMGMRRLHQLLDAIKLKTVKGQMRIPPSAILGRPCLAHVADRQNPERPILDEDGNSIGTYPASVSSRISQYERLQKPEQVVAALHSVPQQAPEPPAEVEEAPAPPRPRRQPSIAVAATGDETDSFYEDEE